ncbi:hypothetical protein CTI14_65770, partial [Methylobacterium radiotolerans]
MTENGSLRRDELRGCLRVLEEERLDDRVLVDAHGDRCRTLSFCRSGTAWFIPRYMTENGS